MATSGSLDPHAGIPYLNDEPVTWDPVKAAANRLRHGISFDEAALAVEDPHRVEELDDGDYGEDRMRVLGLAADRVLVVITTEREADVVRIISARRAARHEISLYFETR